MEENNMNKNIKINPAGLFDWCLEQAARIVAAYRVEAPEGFDVFNQAYGQTDVMHDPKWLMANMAGRGAHDPVRLQMEAQLQRLQYEQSSALQAGQFSAAHAQQLAEFQQRLRESHDTSEANRESRELYRRGLEDTRAERNAIAQEARDTARAASLQQAMYDEHLSKEERASAKQEWLKTLKLPVAPNAGGVQKGAYGPGGPPATPAGAPGGPQYPAVGQPGGPAPSTAGARGYTAAFTNQAGGAPLPYASPQDLSPGPGASPDRAERAFALQQAVNRGEATTGTEELRPLIPPNSITGPAQYDPNLGANVAPNVLGQTVIVGAGDPSVNALGMPVRDYAKTYGSREPGQPGVVGMNLPGGGYFRGSLPKTYNEIPGNRPSFTGRQEAASNIPPQERDFAGKSYTPPTAAFTTTGGSATQPAAQPAPLPGPINEPSKIQIGLAGQKPVDLATISYTGGMSNQAQSAAAELAHPSLSPYGPGSNQAQDAAAQALMQKQVASKQPLLIPPPKKPNQS